ncbi:uncharacterized protein V6R79_024072 [Siganus canaliculatus]
MATPFLCNSSSSTSRTVSCSFTTLSSELNAIFGSSTLVSGSLLNTKHLFGTPALCDLQAPIDHQMVPTEQPTTGRRWGSLWPGELSSAAPSSVVNGYNVYTPNIRRPPLFQSYFIAKNTVLYSGQYGSSVAVTTSTIDRTVDSTVFSTMDSIMFSTMDSAMDNTVFSTMDSAMSRTVFSTMDSAMNSTVFSTMDSAMNIIVFSTVDSAMNIIVFSTVDSAMNIIVFSTVDSTGLSTMDSTVFRPCPAQCSAPWTAPGSAPWL